MKQVRGSKSRFRKFIVDINDFKIIEKIGSGGFGSVYTAQDLKNNQITAAKIINLNEDDERYKLMINREIGIMIRCQHPTIIKFKGFSIKDFHNEKNVTIFMEYANKGSLASFLQKVKSGLLDELYDNTNRQIILIGIARGMMYLHQHQIIHRDLKTDNILLDDKLHPHITDFGLSKFYEMNISMSQSQQCGTSIYMAPEIMEGFKYNGKVDVYAFGILMYEIVTDSIPYPDLENRKLTAYQFTSKVINENYRPKFNNPIKNSIKQLIEKCWSKNPKERPTFEEIFKKLAYNIEDSIDDVYDDQDFTAAEETNKYYLEGVDEDEILFYADEIDNLNSSADDEISIKVKKLVQPLNEENERLKKENELLNQRFESEINLLKKENERLTQKFEAEISPLKKENEEMEKLNKELSQKIDHLSQKLEFLINSLNKEKKEKDGSSVEKAKEQKVEDEEKVNDEEKSKDENNAEEENKYEDETKTKDENKAKVAENAIDEFNKHSIRSQQKIASRMKNEGNQFFTNVNELLLYLLKFNPNESDSYFQLEKSDDTSSLNDVNQIYLHWNSVSILIESKSFSNTDFCNSLLSFNKIIFELRYPSTNFDKSYQFIKELKSNYQNKIEISILFSQINEIDKKFENDANITHVVIDSSVTQIGNCAFKGCKSLKQVQIPSSVTQIGISAFEGCKSLKQVQIPSSVTQIGWKAFSQCSSLRQILIPPSVTQIDNLFSYCYSLAQISIPPSVTLINHGSFWDCISLKQVTIPFSVTKIESNSFYGCKSLEKISIPSSIDQIDGNFLVGCTNLNQVLIYKKADSEVNLKYLDSKLLVFKSDHNKDNYDTIVFAHPSLNIVTIPSFIEKIGKSAFCKCSSLEKITISSSVTQIGQEAFEGCSSLKEISIPSSVTSIGDSAFCRCTSLEQISFEKPSSLTKLEYGTFYYCKALTHISIPSSVTEIGYSSFNECSSLKQISIPSSLNTESNLKKIDVGPGVKVIVQ